MPIGWTLTVFCANQWQEFFEKVRSPYKLAVPLLHGADDSVGWLIQNNKVALAIMFTDEAAAFTSYPLFAPFHAFRQ